MAGQYEGKVAFITGGAIGFGRAFGRALAAEGVAVAVVDIDLPGAEEEARTLRAAATPPLPSSATSQTSSRSTGRSNAS